MNLIKIRSPFFDLLDGFETLGTLKTSYLPATDISENDINFELALAAPGFSKTDFNVKVENDSLIISGEKKITEKKYNLKESFQDTFVRSFTLPKEVKIEEITAAYVDGILTVKVPKDTASIKNKLIEVH